MAQTKTMREQERSPDQATEQPRQTMPPPAQSTAPGRSGAAAQQSLQEGRMRSVRPGGRRGTNGNGAMSANHRAMQDWRQGKLQGLNEEQLARGLGWFSIGLGLAEVLAPRGLGRLIGVRGDHTGLFRFLGLREIAAGVGVLSGQRPAAAVWSRVGGDAMDLALLGAAMASPRADRGKLTTALAAVAGVTALDVICAQQLMRQRSAMTQEGAMRVTKAVTINRSPEELYRFWRDFQNLPRFMKHLEAVHLLPQSAVASSEQTGGEAGAQGGERSHWMAKGPAGATVEWEAEITEDRPNELIAWRSLEGADVDNAGSVRFERAPGGRGTIVKVEMLYNPPAGVVGAGVAKMFGEDPEWQVQDDLRRFKQVMETGEVITTEGQSAGRSSGTSWRYDTAIRS